MMTLADIRDYVDSLRISEHVYMGKLPDKEDESVGVYNSKHQHTYHGKAVREPGSLVAKHIGSVHRMDHQQHHAGPFADHRNHRHSDP